MSKCKHEQWISFHPADCVIHRKKMSKDDVARVKTIVVKICFDCGKILEVRDFGE